MSVKTDRDEIDSLRAQLEAVTRERDEAIAHDRQPYPTAEAYEKVCVLHTASRAETAQLRADVAAMRSALDWASKEAKGRLPDWWHALALAPNPGSKLLEAARKAREALLLWQRWGWGSCDQAAPDDLDGKHKAALSALADAGLE